jgi:hypothetical protein
VKPPPTLPSEEAPGWTRRYEQLRAQVLAPDPLIVTDCRGLNLLIRQGMAAWMRAWHEPLSGAGAATTLAPENQSILPPACPQEEATRLLVNMALSHLRLTPCNA